MIQAQPYRAPILDTDHDHARREDLSAFCPRPSAVTETSLGILGATLRDMSAPLSPRDERRQRVTSIGVLETDRSLLDGFRRGERNALTQVYALYQADVVNVFKFGGTVHERRLSAAPRSHWTDLVQDTFATAFAENSRQSYDGLRPYKAFIVGIAKHKLTAYWRRCGREVPLDFANAEWLPSPEANIDLPTDELNSTRAFIADLRGELLQLYRARYERGLTQHAASAELGMSRQRIRTLELRLKKALRKKINQDALHRQRKPNG